VRSTDRHQQNDQGDSAVNEISSAAPATAAAPSAEERQWGLFAHLSALVGFVVPFGNVIGPLVIWLIKREQMPFVNDQGREALNFNITAGLVGLVLIALTAMSFGIGIFLTAPIGVVLAIAWLVLTIIAAIKANEGQAYRYPVCLRLVN
jgi:uncharacterized Tic20 family protein